MANRELDGLARQWWSDLSARQRTMIVAVGAVEGLLKVAMLIDLRRRSADDVRGAKWAWASTALINSAGVIQLAYFAIGRRRGDGQ